MVSIHPGFTPAATEIVDADRASIRRPLTWLMVARILVNMALRLVYPFNTDIARGLGVSLDSVGRVLGLGEVAGLASLGIGRQLDRGHYARWITVGVGSAGVGALLLGLGGHLWVFGLGFALIACGVAVMTTSAHAWIGESVPYAERGRVIGTFETSWAVALLVGAPVAGVLIARGSWWWPFTAIGVLVLMVLPFVGRSFKVSSGLATLPSAGDRSEGSEGLEGRSVGDGDQAPLAERVWTLRVLGSIAALTILTLGAVVIFASYGAWLKDRHGFTTASVSALTLGFGLVELAGSGSVAAFSDRLGKHQSVAGGAAVMAAASVVVMAAADTRWLAVVGLVLLFGGFEFAYVSQISIISEVGGAARGRVLAANAAITTVARAVGVALGSWLYVRVGITAVAGVTAACAVATVAIALASRTGSH